MRSGFTHILGHAPDVLPLAYNTHSIVDRSLATVHIVIMKTCRVVAHAVAIAVPVFVSMFHAPTLGSRTWSFESVALQPDWLAALGGVHWASTAVPMLATISDGKC
eukprot:5706793-Amphidinium_carterae.3